MLDGTESRTSTSLIRGAQAQDPAPWQRLVETYGRGAYRWCRHAGLQPADASNVVQEVLRAVARKVGDFDHRQDGASFRGWLRRITQNKIRDHFRESGKQPGNAVGGTDAHRRLENIAELPSLENEDSTSSTSHVMDARLIELVRSQCSQRDWHIFWRVVVDGQSAVDVGEEFGVTANAVRLIKMRTLRKLRESLG